LAACGGPADEPDADITPVESPTPEPATAIPAPTATVESTETPTPEPLTPGAIFERLSPSVAHISLPDGTGSGALLEGGYILTNYHVVWPFDVADVAFPDGTTFEDVPLAAHDPLFDLALLGPVEADLPPIVFVDGESAAVGSEILLIGYPGESDQAPQPTLTEGLISRVREWEDGDVTFFQTSSAVAGGQSGGIAVSPDGKPIGLSGLRFTEANYGLIASAADLMPHVERLLTAERPESLPPEVIKRDRWNFETIHDMRVFRVDEPEADVTVTVDGPTDHVLVVAFPDGHEETYSDDGLFGEERVTFTTPVEGVPLFVIADYEQEWTSAPVPFTMTSNTSLTLVEDADDGQTLHPGDVYTGTVDFPFDSDVFEMVMSQGQVVNFRVDSIGFDPTLIIDAGMGVDLIVMDEDSGGGLFDVSAELTYEAPRGGTYTIAVYDFFGDAQGAGYTLVVSEPAEGAPTPTAPDPTPTPIAAAAGLMRVFDSPEIPFTIEVPFDFVDDWRTVNCREWFSSIDALACLSDPDPTGQVLTMLLLVEDLQTAGVADITLEDLGDIIRGFLEENPAFDGVTQTSIETAQGEPALLIKANLGSMGLHMTRLLTIAEGREGHYVTFLHTEEEQEMVDYLITTFRVR
jgi:hypothetical protein